jgi:hypothetical protein
VAFYILLGRRSLGSEPFGLNAVDKLDRTVFVALLPDICDHFGRIEEVVGSNPITSTRGNPQRCRSTAMRPVPGVVHNNLPEPVVVQC